MMKKVEQRQLMRLLHGELPAAEARALAGRLGREPELAAALERLRATWEGLELPPPVPAPPGFATRVGARLREVRQREVRPGLGTAPRWVQAMAALALMAGVVAGVGIGRAGLAEGGGAFAAAGSRPRGMEITAEESWSADISSLAETYWTAMADDLPAAPETPQGEIWNEGEVRR